jgi:hypothetical protein
LIVPAVYITDVFVRPNPHHRRHSARTVHRL